MDQHAPPVREPVPARGAGAVPRRFVFVLLEQFTLLSFACAIEPLRIANRMAGRTLYSWVSVGEGGGSVRCSNGVEFLLDGDLGEIARDDTVMICGGIDIHRATTRRIVSWLRREARRGVPVGGLCTAGHTLARAGLLDGKRPTIHWEHQDSFPEEFDELIVAALC
mgnify:FL=1